MIFESHSAQETIKFAKKLGQAASKGDIFCLRGYLGAGKTVFCQGFAQGMGYNGRVVSPTFTIMNEYIGGRLPVYHFDLYRLDSAEDLEGIGYEEYLFGDGVCLVEWPERAEEAFESFANANGADASANNGKFFFVNINTNSSKGDEYRELHIENISD